MSDSVGKKATVGAVWASIDRVGYMALQFIVNMVLARLLLPSEFGVIGMLAIFLTVSQVLIDGGFSSALIQKKEPTQTDYTTIFYWNIFLSVVLYLLLFFTAPLIADFYRLPVISPVLRVIGVTLVISGITSIQQTRLRKQLAFKTIAITNIISYFLSGCCAIFLAFRDYGVWSLVFNQILFGVLTAFFFGILTRWHPSLCFSRKSMRELFSFGGYMLAANVLQEACKNFQGLIIGKRFSDAQMGYFSQAYKLDQVSSYSIPQIIVQVMYPVYSSIQDDSRKMREILSMNIRVISYLIFPLACILILVAEPLITGLYGEKWLPSVPYYQILCVGGMFVCLQNINFYAVAARGYSRVLFHWSWYKWGFLLVAILVGMYFGMNGILWGIVLSNANIYIVNAALVNKYVGLSMFCQFRLLLPILLLVGFLTFGIYIISDIIGVNILFLVPVYIILYIVMTYLFRMQAFHDTMVLLNKIRNRKR